MTDDEREALKWLHGAVWPGIANDAKHRATILALLDAPRMPRPDEVPDSVLEAAEEARSFERGTIDDASRAFYRTIYDHYTAPKPKKVEAWAVVNEEGGVFLYQNRPAREPAGFRIVRLVEDRDGE